MDPLSSSRCFTKGCLEAMCVHDEQKQSFVDIDKGEIELRLTIPRWSVHCLRNSGWVEYQCIILHFLANITWVVEYMDRNQEWNAASRIYYNIIYGKSWQWSIGFFLIFQLWLYIRTIMQWFNRWTIKLISGYIKSNYNMYHKVCEQCISSTICCISTYGQ